MYKSPFERYVSFGNHLTVLDIRQELGRIQNEGQRPTGRIYFSPDQLFYELEPTDNNEGKLND